MASGDTWQAKRSKPEAAFTREAKSPSWAEVLVSLGVSILFVGAIWVLTDAGGAVGIARSDDWSYLLTQFEFAESGRFVMNNWAVTMLVGQTLAAAPIVAVFGPSIAALQAFVAALSVASLVATYVVVRQVLPTGWSSFAVASLAISPVYGPSIVSFMTDVPSLLFLSSSLLAGMWALRGPHIHWYWLIASGLLALVAFTFRDYAIIAFPAVIIVGLALYSDRRVRLVLISALLLVAASALGLYVWRHSLANDLQLPGWDLAFSFQLLARGTLTIALLIAPGLAAVSWWRVNAVNPVRTVALYAIAAGISAVTLLVAGFELLGNVIHPFGTSWLLNGSGVRMWPLWVNRLMIVAAFMSLTLAIALAWRIWSASAGESDRLSALMAWTRNSPARAVVVVFPILLLLAHSGATIVLGTWYIDRYFILVIPFLSAALLRVAIDRKWATRGTQLMIPGLCLLLLTGLGLHVVDFNARFDGARWEMGEQLVDQGYRAEEIDAGVEWVTFHALDIGQSPEQREYRPDRNWWTERYPDQPVCVTVTAIDAASIPDQDAAASTVVSTLLGREYSLVARPGPDPCP